MMLVFHVSCATVRMYEILRSKFSVRLETYHGVSAMIRKILFISDLLAQLQSSILYDLMGWIIILQISTLFSIYNCDFLAINQLLSCICFSFFDMCSFQFNFEYTCNPRYFTYRIQVSLNLTGGQFSGVNIISLILIFHLFSHFSMRFRKDMIDVQQIESLFLNHFYSMVLGVLKMSRKI